MLAGCATRPVSDSDAQPVPGDQVLDPVYLRAAPGTGQVTIKRDSGFAGSLCTTRVFVDARPMVDLRTSQKVVLYIPAGDHVFSAGETGLCSAGGVAEIRGNVKPGEAIAFRIGSATATSGFAIYATAF